MSMPFKRKDLGPITSYAEAYEGGYTGTNDEFKQNLATALNTIERIGNIDGTTNINEESIKLGAVGKNQTLSFNFVHYANTENNRYTAVVILGSNKYFYLNNYTSGNLTVQQSGNNWRTSSFQSDIDHAIVYGKIINWQGKVRIQFSLIAPDGTFRYQWYDLAEQYDTVQSVVLTVNHTYLDCYQQSIIIDDTRFFEDVPFTSDNTTLVNDGRTKRIGLPDFSSGWTDAGLQTKVGEVGVNRTLSFDFVNHSRAEETWDNFILIFDDNTYFRPDNYSWGSYTVANSGNNWDPNTQKEDMDGALVHAEVINQAGFVRIQFNITTANEGFRYQYYDLQSTNFTGSAYSVALTVDHAYADLYLDSTRVYGTELVENTPFVVENDGGRMPGYRRGLYINQGGTTNGDLSRWTPTQVDFLRYVNGTLTPRGFFTPTNIFFNTEYPNYKHSFDITASFGSGGYLRLGGTEPYISLVKSEYPSDDARKDLISAVLTAEKLQQSNQLVTRVGSADFSTEFVQPPTIKSDIISVPAGYELQLALRNYHPEVDSTNQYNLMTVISDDTDIQAYLRLDNFGWGSGYDNTYNQYDWQWGSFIDDTQGALVNITAKNFGEYTTIELLLTTATGRTYRQFYRVATSACNIYFTVDHSYIDIMNNSIKLSRISPIIDVANELITFNR